MNHSESIILRRIALGEADLLISFFSSDLGKLKGIAKNAKRSKRRFGGTLETGYIVTLGYKESFSSDLVKIHEAQLTEPAIHRVRSLSETTAIWLALETADKFLPEREKSEAKFQLLKRYLLAIYEGRLSRAILIYFLMRWVSLSGYEPMLDACTKCGKKEISFFSSVTGGFCCGDCISKRDGNFIFDKESLIIFRKLANGNINVAIDDKCYAQLLEFFFFYCAFLLPKPLRLKKYLPILMDIDNDK